MQWRVFQEGRVYVKQNLNNKQIIIEVQEMVASDSHLADRKELILFSF